MGDRWRSRRQSVELIGCRRGLIFDLRKLPVANRMHGFNARVANLRGPPQRVRGMGNRLLSYRICLGRIVRLREVTGRIVVVVESVILPVEGQNLGCRKPQRVVCHAPGCGAGNNRGGQSVGGVGARD